MLVPNADAVFTMFTAEFRDAVQHHRRDDRHRAGRDAASRTVTITINGMIAAKL